jgi:sphingomyelin phosphodiesterase 2
MVPMSLAHKLITTHAPVVDVWRLKHPDSSLGAAIDPVEQDRGLPVPSARLNLQANGATCDSILNTWRWDEKWQKDLDRGKKILVSEDVQDPKAKRLDYVFAGDGSNYAAKRLGHQSTPHKWELADVRVGMVERHSTLLCSLSDHFSVEATLTRRLRDEPTNEDLFEVEKNPVESKGLEVSNQEYLPTSVYDEIVKVIESYTLRERRQRRLRLSHFAVQILIAIACLAAVWFSPRNFVSFLLMLLSTLGLGAGIIDGLIGGLFVGSELRALKEFEWEIRSTRKAAEGAIEAWKEDDEAVVDW